MGKTWFKPNYVPSDLDPVTKAVMPGVLAPGMYAEDEATFDEILADPRVGKIERAFNAPPEAGRPRAWPPITIAGIRVRVANEAELAVLRGVTIKTPPPPEEGLTPDEIKSWRGVADRIRNGKARPHPMRIPPGINRAAKRAAAAAKGRS
ncbi:hypothetical protein [Methylobacterium sp. Leaf117]|uniref:hypothetical protein n=1 Tax=Methylobacterium sp. Leaf117 TaxID=1736260 RepID=UPI0006F25513|nr:hypothetical protein [Methylobacterium sp. Leaf117]KQP90785.1 hypothetical protein ASF57_23550 [Methylobacterium sp. Leaf117]